MIFFCCFFMRTENAPLVTICSIPFMMNGIRMTFTAITTVWGRLRGEISKKPRRKMRQSTKTPMELPNMILRAVVNGWLGILLAVVGFIVVVAGLGYVHHGYTHHEVVEKQD